MAPIDAAAAAVTLAATLGVVIARAASAWRTFRMVRRTTDLMAEGVRMLEDASERGAVPHETSARGASTPGARTHGKGER